MKRLQNLAFVSALFLPAVMAGCTEETKVETEKTIKTPDGSIKETDTKTIEKTGDAKTP